MKIGILKESPGENRVVMLPETVSSLVDKKNEVLVEKDAGITAYAPDKAYEEAGAKISNRSDIFKNANMLLSIHPLEKDELKKVKKEQILVAVFNPFFNLDLVKEVAEKGILSFSMDLIPRSTRGQAMDILSSQATVSGYKAVLTAANLSGEFLPMFMSAAGTIKPAKMLILGAGVAGLQAIATARKLGAVVEVFDVRAAVKEEVKSLGGKFVEVEGAKDDAAAGGYAVEQTEDFKKKQQQAIHDHSVKSDIIISTAQIFGREAPLLVKKETVEQMKPGSVIIDLAASTGGNCELTKDGELYDHKQVRILGKSDFPSDMPTDASRMFGKNVLNFLNLIITDEGELNLDNEDEIISGTCLTRENDIANEKVKEKAK
jgi:NAD(P) transhydrogenase subunit alpha